jgi:hypothetical protein
MKNKSKFTMANEEKQKALKYHEDRDYSFSALLTACTLYEAYIYELKNKLKKQNKNK